MPLIEGQKFTLNYKHHQALAEIVKKEWLNPQDRGLTAKRDANPVFQITVQVAGLDHNLIGQIEITDDNQDALNRHLEHIFSDALERDQSKH